jgi:hypothetical protein
MIKYFTIYGERCSGTNFLEHAIKNNFELEYNTKYSWKHFFGFYNFNNNISNDEEDQTLFIGIVRNPITWINSFFNKMHHIPIENRQNINTFLFNEFYSIYEDKPEEIIEDRNIVTKDRYKNIFELRKVKNNYLIYDMKDNVKNYILIKYEDLRDNYDVVLDFLQKKFNLNKKNKNYIKIDTYKGKLKSLFIKKNVTLNPNIIKKIIENVELKQENSLGYLINQ